MQTNKNIAKDSELAKRGQALIDAGQAYWDEYRRVCGGDAVVWLLDDEGKLIVFTRGEYRGQIMENINRIRETMFFNGEQAAPLSPER